MKVVREGVLRIIIIDGYKYKNSIHNPPIKNFFNSSATLRIL